ncbi:ABC transporter permease [Kitasatospora sp. NPDC059648]|uniref:ABC transporter permease n=1 Tax=Kitasatospora sp. NPDC059648 TaxID=3346894 RepID=UPI00369AD070
MPVETDALPVAVTATIPPPELVAVDHRGRRRRLPRWVRRSAAPVLLLALWQALGTTGVLPAQALPPPSTVLAKAAAMTADGTLPSAMAVSLQRVLYGLTLGGLAGIALALASGLSRLGEDLVDPIVQMVRTVPFIGLIPLLIIWVGIGEAPKVVLIALGVGFNLYLNVHAGIRSVDNALVETGETLGLTRRQQIRHIVLPGALPGLMTGLRYAFTVSWLALVFGETINADNGIGFLMNQAREFLQTDVIVLCLLVYALLGLAADLIVRTLERILLPWRPTFSGT